MDIKEAKHIIQAELDFLRAKSYSDLVKLIDSEHITTERTGPSGNVYQIEIQAFWDSKPNSHIRIMGSIDDGRWRAFCPLTESFIKSPLDEFESN